MDSPVFKALDRRKRWASSRAALIVLALLAATASRSFAAEDRISATEGVDLIIVVDVSRSMYESADRRPGSDPNRLRWDAVKLVVDLLTRSDRVLIQRFNHDTPPAADSPIFLDQEGTVPFRDEHEFPDRLVQLTEENRQKLAQKIALFNTTDDLHGSLDQGETRIIHTLQEVSSRIEAPAGGRQTRVLLLTDGVDTKHRGGRYQTDTELRTALSFFTGQRPGTAAIPVKIVGLNLSGSDDEERMAENFLLRIAAVTGGSYERAQDTLELISIFRSWIWRMKGYWTLEKSYKLSEGDGAELETMLINGIIDLGVLSYGVQSEEVEPKNRTAPPAHRLGFSWKGLERPMEPQAEHRSGKEGSVYDYFYFGRNIDSQGLLQSPFADLRRPAFVSLRMRGAGRSQKLHLAKSTQQPLFELASPRAGSRFYRQQTLKIRVQMADNPHFRPDDFSFQAELSPLQYEAETVPITLRLDPDNPRGLIGSVSLRRLPLKEDTDYFSLSITAEGTPESETALAGFRGELPTRTLSVEDAFHVRADGAIELTNDTPVSRVNVKASFPDVPEYCAAVEEDVGLNLQFLPPKPRDQSQRLDPAHFVLATGNELAEEGPVTMEAGNLSLGVALNPENLPPAGVAYEPGALVISGAEGVRLPESLKVPVNLRMGLEEVRLAPAPGQLKAATAPVGTKPIQVSFDSRKSARLGAGPITAELRTISEATNQTFTDRELWLQEAGEPIAQEARQQQLSLDSGRSFQVYFHPGAGEGPHEPGKYQYQLLVTGSRVAANPVPLDLLIQVPNIVLQSSQQTAYANPGETCYVRFAARLEGVTGEQAEVQVVSENSPSRFLFRQVDAADETPYELPVICPSRTNPLELVSTADDDPHQWSTVEFAISVPSNMPPGRYRWNPTLTGPGVEDEQVQIDLVVNQLEIEERAPTDDGDTKWRPTRQIQVVQFFKHDLEKTIRVRHGLDQQLTADAIDILPLAPFEDSSGDSMPLPTYTKELSDDGESVLVKLHFPAVSNGQQSLPYRLRVIVQSDELRVSDEELNVLVRFWPIEDLLAD